MMTLFRGWDKNYGIYKLTGEMSPQGKAQGQAKSLAGNLTVELWHDHLVGIQGLGVIPITDKSEVMFAAIDVDEYPLDLTAIAMNVKQLNLPLIPCRTKSGGVHLYLFLKEWAPAKIVQQRMREMAAELGYGTSEIFPKQVTILAERGDVGQWINMPYFDAGRTERYAVDEHGKKMSLEVFLRYAQQRRITAEELVAAPIGKEKKQLLKDGPPCLNHLASVGFAPGTRNNGMFNLGVYAQKVDPDNWQNLIVDYNKRFFDPPLSPSEISGVIKSLNKGKGYNYTCKQQPIVSHCQLTKCRTCKFGIGIMGVGMPKYGTLCKVDTKPPIWFVDVEGGGRMEMETKDLHNIRDYQLRCIEAHNIMPPLVKNELWNEVIQKLLDDVTIVEMPKEATPEGQVWLALDDFCTSRVQGKEPGDLLLGKPFTKNKLTYFRLKDFMAFLERNKFKDWGLRHVANFIRKSGGENVQFNVKGKCVQAYSIPEFSKHENEESPLPENPGKEF